MPTKSRKRGWVATDYGLHQWETWHSTQTESLKKILSAYQERTKESLSESTIRRIRDGKPTDVITSFFQCAGIAPVEGIHFRVVADEPTAVPIRDFDDDSAIFERFERLSTAQRQLLISLTLFPGGLAESTANRVLGPATWTLLPELERRGVVTRKAGAFHLNSRFVQVTQLVAKRYGIDDIITERFCSYYYSQLLVTAEATLGPGDRAAADWFRVEQANASIALHRVLERDTARGSEMAAAFGQLCFRAELYEEGRSMLAMVLSHLDNPRDIYYVRCLAYYARCTCRLFDFRTGRRHLRKAIKLARALGDPVSEVLCQTFMAVAFSNRRTGRLDPRQHAVTLARFQRVRQILASHQLHPYYHVASTFNQVQYQMQDGKYEDLKRLATEAHKHAHNSGNLEAIAATASLLAALEHHEAHYPEAIRAYRDAAHACEASGHALRLLIVLMNLVEVYVETENFSLAIETGRAAKVLSYSVQEHLFPARIRFQLALARALSGDTDQARAEYADAAQIVSQHHFDLPVGREWYLPAVCLIAEDPRVRAEAIVGLRPREHVYFPKSYEVRNQVILRLSETNGELTMPDYSLFDTASEQSLLSDLKWLGPDGHLHLLSVNGAPPDSSSAAWQS